MAYHVLLDTFEGPLDLLLHLITQARIEIRDIFVSPIIDQYLSFVEQMPAEHMERTTEFVTMATRLLEIKSRWLLPRQKEDEEEESPEEDLIRQLELYRQYKEASGMLREKKEQADLVRYRVADEQYLEERLEPEDLTLDRLIKAFERLKLRLAAEEAEGELGESILRDHFTVREKVAHITQRLMILGRTRFTELFDGISTREEVVVTFLALLELARNNMVDVEQNPGDRDIMIVRREEAETDGTEFIPEDGGY